jgi:hypothetical protein
MRPRMLRVRSIGFAEARSFVARHHAHALPPMGWKFGCGVDDALGLVGVVMVGRPIGRALNDEQTFGSEVGRGHQCSQHPRRSRLPSRQSLRLPANDYLHSIRRGGRVVQSCGLFAGGKRAGTAVVTQVAPMPRSSRDYRSDSLGAEVGIEQIRPANYSRLQANRHNPDTAT